MRMCRAQTRHASRSPAAKRWMGRRRSRPQRQTRVASTGPQTRQRRVSMAQLLPWTGRRNDTSLPRAAGPDSIPNPNPERISAMESLHVRVSRTQPRLASGLEYVLHLQAATGTQKHTDPASRGAVARASRRGGWEAGVGGNEAAIGEHKNFFPKARRSVDGLGKVP